MSPDPPINVLLFTFIKRDKERNLANDPYEPREKLILRNSERPASHM